MSEPRISANQLVEYTRADATKRRAIIKGHKAPKTFMVRWYLDAKAAIVRQLCDDPTGLDHILREISRLAVGTEEQQKSAEALEAFAQLNLDLLTVGDLTLSPGPQSAPKLLMGGTIVSVQPDIVISGIYRGKQVAGGLKIHVAKLSTFGTSDTATLANIVRLWSADQTSDTNRKFCFGLDVFGGVLEQAPTAFKATAKRLEASCEEIRSRWTDF